LVGGGRVDRATGVDPDPEPTRVAVVEEDEILRHEVSVLPKQRTGARVGARGVFAPWHHTRPGLARDADPHRARRITRRARDLHRAGAGDGRVADPTCHHRLLPATLGVARVGLAVAVVVNCIVADLRGAGVYGHDCVVAVVVVLHSARGLSAGADRPGLRAVAVAVRVRVPAGLDRVSVDLPIAVVVDAVTDLGGAGVNRNNVVVAVGAQLHVARGLRAVVYDIGTVAVAVAVLVAVERLSRSTSVAVAVVINKITLLERARVDRLVTVVTVGGVVHVRLRHVMPDDRAITGSYDTNSGAVTVVIIIGVPLEFTSGPRLIDQTIAVVVDVVAGLDRTRLRAGEVVVAVGVVSDVVAGHEAGVLRAPLVAVAVVVAVRVPELLIGDARVKIVDLAVAVVVDQVADLVGTRIYRCLEVVAVGVVGAVADTLRVTLSDP